MREWPWDSVGRARCARCCCYFTVEWSKLKGDLTAIYRLVLRGQNGLGHRHHPPHHRHYINQSSSEAARGSAASIYAKAKGKYANKIIINDKGALIARPPIPGAINFCRDLGFESGRVLSVVPARCIGDRSVESDPRPLGQCPGCVLVTAKKHVLSCVHLDSCLEGL
eukprot:COSAG02_NODE_7234_length_3104_cov_16.569384_2_plen_167_part_00